jgi:hypothetical protein
MMDKFTLILGLICLVIIIGVVAIPAILIWVLNTLFTVGIVWSLKTWFAALLLCGFLGTSVVHNKK